MHISKNKKNEKKMKAESLGKGGPERIKTTKRGKGKNWGILK
jgi:hypothetical protein